MNTISCKEARVASFKSQKSERGQTLIIAMIVLGLLLILGFVFLGIVDGNIRGGRSAKVRSQSNDLAEAGIRFVQQQLVFSAAGADWRGLPTNLPPAATTGTGVNFTRDPDAYYLRSAATDTSGNPLAFPGLNNFQDLGGPDGLGPFIRINYDSGRALVRVRLGSTDANIFSASAVGPLRSPGKVHSYLIVESIGREGAVSATDPTTLMTGNGVQFQNYADAADLQSALSSMKQFDSQVVNSRHLMALNTTGLLDNALFISNKFNVNRAADIGVPNPIVNGTEVLPGLGVLYNGSDVGAALISNFGTQFSIAAPTSNVVPTGFGSILSNADLNIHGTLLFNFNDQFGDGLRCNGNIQGDDNAVLGYNLSTLNPTTGVWTQTPASSGQTLTPAQFNSRSATFDSQGGRILDGVSGIDIKGVPRGIGRLVPPSILQNDPQTGLNRYLALTRDTMGTNGALGHGNGIYVSNTADQQGGTDEAGRAGEGTSQSLIYDLFNPNNGSAGSAWRGPFYVPPGATLNLQPDGFTIQLDNGTWPGLNTSTLRYRIGRFNGQLSIVDSSQDQSTIGGVTPANYSLGQAFNGVLYFEGNVRVRGQIPTDIGLSVVSMSNIYIDGSITKGVTGNDYTDSFPTSGSASGPYLAYGKVLGRPSKSALMLMARDNVIVNTTQFVGLENGQSVQEVDDHQNDTGYSAFQMSTNPGADSGLIDLRADFLNDPQSSVNPITQTPFAVEYKDCLNNQALNSKLFLTETMADGSGAASLIGMNINPGFGTIGNAQFCFPGTPGNNLPANYPSIDNTASDYLQTGATSINSYGLGTETWQRYAQFESRAFDLVYPGQSSYAAATGELTNTAPNTDPFVAYTLFAPGSNDLQIATSSIVGVPTNPYLLAKTAIAPSDVRIEASIFAEEGSFVILPGTWFSPNPNDTRTIYNGNVTATSVAAANATRLSQFGNTPDVPFYGEPLDVKVNIVGSVTENMPLPESNLAEESKKWGWIPLSMGGTGNSIPSQHVPANETASQISLVPNFIISYDPDVATGRIGGFSGTNSPTTQIRSDSYNRPLLPMPRLPVSPVFTYFGDLQ